MGSQPNSVASPHLSPEVSVLEKLKADWRTPYTKNAITAVDDLYDSLATIARNHRKLIDGHSKTQEDLVDILENKSNEFAIDDCIRWQLLSVTVENLNDPTVNKYVDDTFRSLIKILVKNQPYLAFLPTVDGVIPGDFSDLYVHRNGEKPHLSEEQQYLFKWDCQSNIHVKTPHTSMLKRLHISNSGQENSKTSPFYQALFIGADDLVTVMIDGMEEFLKDSPKANMENGQLFCLATESVRPKVLGNILGTHIHPHGTALEYTAQQYIKSTKRKLGLPSRTESFGPGQGPTGHLKIIETLLIRDPTLVLRNTNFANKNGSENARPDQTFEIALSSENCDIMVIILKRGPPNFLQEGPLLRGLEKPSQSPELQQMSLAAETLLRVWCESNPLTLEITKKIIRFDQPSLGWPQVVRERLQALVGDKRVATELLNDSFEQNSAGFVETILSMVPGIFNIELAKNIVRRGLYNIWKLDGVQAAWKKLRETESKSHEAADLRETLLPVAVGSKQIEFVNEFLEEKPALACKASQVNSKYAWQADEKDVGLYPLWHNNCFIQKGKLKWQPRTEKDMEGRKEIRNALVRACIRTTENMQELCRIFEYSHEAIADLCFDISRFNSKSFPLDLLAKALPRINGLSPASQRSHRYEPILRYADFPNLDCDRDDHRYGREFREHHEVFDILKWLKEKMVMEIVKLRVPDRMYNSHDEHEIAKHVVGFQVRNLDWRCLDLAISAFEKPEDVCLETLHLYSSGKQAVITHWMSPEGIECLPRLRDLKIHLVKESMTKSSISRLETSLKNRLGEIKKRRDLLNEEEFHFKVDVESWNTQPSRHKTSLDDIAEKAFPKLWPFIKGYREYMDNKRLNGDEPRATRVAVIDNGIMNINPLVHAQHIPDLTTPLTPVLPVGTDQGTGNTRVSQEGTDKKHTDSGSHRVVDGKSFLDENYTMGSWSFASDPHGTQMINLICAIDPRCDIYVAKIIEGRYGIAPDRLARAIRWAMKMKVDVISMSLASYEEDKKVKSAVEDAEAEGILLLCSTHDEGLNVGKAYPACMRETITFAASNQIGQVTQNMDKDAYDFRIPATNVFAGVVPFMQFDENVSGSSVATAIGAGLSSLMIACHHLANKNRRRGNLKWKRSMVSEKLEAMASGRNSKYILLEKFCDINNEPGDRKNPNIAGILEKHFAAGDKDLKDY
ncbi:hypothetical protein EDB80DRAFT_735975 [Ilyonectria destructans]|nr:hypothetical protein EDB80DRAFT_735975 [Ilyonectria destructans]